MGKALSGYGVLTNYFALIKSEYWNISNCSQLGAGEAASARGKQPRYVIKAPKSIFNKQGSFVPVNSQSVGLEAATC